MPWSRSPFGRSWNGDTAQPSAATFATRNGGDVDARGISLSYRDAVALRDVNLHVRDGELLALLGPSGSGKTTLLRVIAGLETPSTGRVFFGNEDVTDRAVQQRGIGFVFQHYALFRHLSVFDNVAYGLRSQRHLRLAETATRARVADLLDLVQLSDLGSRFPSQLSGGQRQRVALARALAAKPRVLLLDEPFGALDARVRKDLRRWLREIHRETRQTTIFVTHDQDEALELADRVAILNRGRVEQIGNASEICDRPASAFVAEFVGDRMRIPVLVDQGRAWLGGTALPLNVRDIQNGEATLFLTPSELTLANPSESGVPAVVNDIRRVGRSYRLDVRLRDVDVTLEIVSAVKADHVQLGAPISLVVPESCLFFSP